MNTQAAINMPGQPNSDAGLLKTVAMITMLIDHVGAIFFPGLIELRVIGRIAFPIFCWGVAAGSVHTKSLPKYALRLLIGGLIAQPFYMLALDHTIREWNVMATLLLGLLAIAGIQQKKWFSHIWAPIVCLGLAAMQQMDYGWRGVLLIILMYLARDSRGALAALMVSFCLYWGAGSSEVTRLFGMQIKPQLDLGVIPAAGDVKAKSKARIPGVDSQAEMKMQVLDYATFDGGLGFELGKGDFTLGLNYNLQASEHRTGHGVFGSLRYEF